MTKANVQIRDAAKAAKVPLWLIAHRLGGLSEVTLIRRLRFELPDVERRKILNIIKELCDENNQNERARCE